MSDVVERASRRYRLQRAEGRSIAFWGVILLSVTEGVLFLNLLFSYVYLWSISTAWPPGDVTPPELGFVSIRTVALLSSSLTIWFAERAIGRGQRRRVWAWTLVTVALAVFFLAGHLHEFLVKLPTEFTWNDHAYGSLYWTILNVHGAHVAVGILIWLFVLVRLGRGAYGPDEDTQFATAAIYWHFVDVVWVVVFPTMYLAPNLFAGGG